MKMRKLLSLLLTLMMLMSSFALSATVASAADTQIKNIIYMIPDGGGMEPFYLADAVKQAGGFNRSKFPYATQQTVNKMYLKDYLVGAETTYSANYAVTDSAASGTALATGKKTNNYYIGIDHNRKPIATILEAAQTLDMRTGLVSTYPWAHATPASFSAHAQDRYYYRAIAEQQINQGLDVVLPFNATGGYSFDEAATEIAARGYTQVTSLAQMNSIQPGTKVWGSLGGDRTFARRDITNEDSYPTLAEMTSAAITALNVDDGKGFFLMVEGSAVDGGGHANNALDMVSEFIAFDEACKVAIEFAKARTDTVVVACPDHDTGGMNVKNQETAVSLIQSGTNPGTSYVTWDSGNHTDRNGGVFVYKPDGVAGIPGTASTPGVSTNWNNYVINNTDIAPWLAGLIGVDLDEVTKELFVDVSRMGTYTPVSDTYYDGNSESTDTTSEHTGYFTFKDYDLTVVRNQSVATYNGQTVDMDGEVAVYSGGRFYVPQNLLDQLGIEVDNSGAMETVSSELTGADLVNNVIESIGCSVNADSATILQSHYSSAILTFQIGVPKTAYYDVQAIIDTSNRPQYGNVLYGTGLTGTFDNGQKIQFIGTLASYKDWVDDNSASVLLEEGNHTLTFISGDGANNIVFTGLRLVENISMGDPEATPTPTPTPGYDYNNITKENAPYAGVYSVTSDKAVTLTNETGHTVTLAAGTPAYFYLIKGNNNITMSDASANLTFTALADNGMDYIDQVNAGTTPITSTHYSVGYDSSDNITDYLVSTYGNVTTGSDSFSIPNSSSVTVRTPEIPAGIYYMTLLTSNASTYVSLTSDTGHTGQYASTLAGNATHYEDGSSDFLLMYLREGVNEITIANNGGSTAVVKGLRCSRTSTYKDDAQVVLANCKVVHDSYDPDAPEATPEPTPEVSENAIGYSAAYAGVYQVTSDKAVTLTSELNSVANVAAGGSAYIYLIQGHNEIKSTDISADVTFTELAGNGMNYINQITISSEPIIIGQEDAVASGVYKTLEPGETYTFTYTPSKGMAGLVYPYLKFSDYNANTFRVTTDTGFYADLAKGNTDSVTICWADVERTDIEFVYVRNGENTVTIENIGANTAVLQNISMHSVGELADHATWGPQLAVANLKPVIIGEPVATPTPVPTEAPTPTPVPTDAPTPTPTPVPADTIVYHAPFAGVFAVTSDKAVTLENETASYAQLAAGETKYIYLIAGDNKISVTDATANLTFTALAGQGLDKMNQIQVTGVCYGEQHVDADITNIIDSEGVIATGTNADGAYISMSAGSKVTLAVTMDASGAGIVYPYLNVRDGATNTFRVTSDTGFYAELLKNHSSWQTTCWADGTAQQDMEFLYVREGINYITIENTGSSTAIIGNLRMSMTAGEDSLADHAVWGPQMNLNNLKVVAEAGGFTDFVLDTETATASVSFKQMGTMDNEIVTLYIAEYDATTGKLLQVNLTTIDMSELAIGESDSYTTSLTGVTGTLKAMLLNDNLVPYFTVAE